MSIQHFQFQEALAQLAEDRQRDTSKSVSKNRPFLTKAILRSGGKVWELSIDIIFDDPPNVITHLTNPIIKYVKLNEIKQQTDISTDNEVIDVFGVHKAITLADNYINSNHKITEAYLNYLVNASSLKERIWKLGYACTSHKEDHLFLVIMINVDTLELLSTTIEHADSNKE